MRKIIGKRNNIYPLFDENIFHDACGVGFITTQSGKPEKRILPLALGALKRLSHRGAKSYDNNSGDGSGLLVDIPINFFKMVLKEDLGIIVKRGTGLAIAMIFYNGNNHQRLKQVFQHYGDVNKLKLLHVRKVPVNDKSIGDLSRKTRPHIFQYIFSYRKSETKNIEQKLYVIRKKVEKESIPRISDFYVCSFSSKTIVYKGLMSSGQLDMFYLDLSNKNFIVKVALFHERFSTNTGSTWKMAQPFQMVAHNGEFNTIKGNRLWMRARENEIGSDYWGSDIKAMKPIVNSSGSDSESFDSVLEFLVRSGRNIFDSMMIMIPDSYSQDKKYYNNRIMDKKMRDYFIYHENFMQPWDGPSAIIFTDGDFIGAKMDRNGLRPLRYSITKDGLVIMASEAGIIDIEDDNLVLHHHMKSEEIFGVSLEDGQLLMNKEIKIREASKKEYTKLIRENLTVVRRNDAFEEFKCFSMPDDGFDKRNRLFFRWSQEDLNRFLLPMSDSSRESIGSMGDDTPLAVLSKTKRKFYDYFKQSFAQVTNPPIDSIRERSVMSLHKYLGSEENLLSKSPTLNIALSIESPVLSPREVNKILDMSNVFNCVKILCHCKESTNLDRRIERIRRLVEKLVLSGARIIFLSDENLKTGYVPIPMPIIVSAVHHYLIDKGIRNKVSLICSTGSVVEEHHIAVLIALGASAIYPYMAYEIIREYYNEDNWVEKMSNYRYALEKGLLKIMSKMGISTVSSYHGSMLLHSIGLGSKISKKYFPSISSKLGGIEINEIMHILVEDSKELRAEDVVGPPPEIGSFRFRKNGELHGYAPRAFKQIQALSLRKANKIELQDSDDIIYIRDLFSTKSSRKPVDIKSVEAEKLILKRFGSGGISFGAISEASHRELAKGVFLAGARSNTGEGGELEDRYSISNPEKSTNSYIKQIASGRFGVTADYLSAANEIQIKIAQGAKPGEGGQLPGFKVNNQIASARSATPGLPLISPPPHHDIYSIEDIKQLIYDLKDVNPRAKVSVKLVSQPGIGIIASGLVKAGANIVLISGNDGGTGASPLGSLKHTGFPWEYGLAETHQILYANGLRDYVTLRVDGGLKWSKDIIIASILGAEEFDFGTSALVALGCVMARRCHLNTCPAGIATTNKKYEKKFRGSADNVTKYLKEVAGHVRKDLAKLGYSNLHDIIGRTDLLKVSDEHLHLYNALNLNFDAILNKYAERGLPLKYDMKLRFSSSRRKRTIDEKILDEVRPDIVKNGHAVVYKKISNTDRTIGSRISGEIAFLFGKNNFKGSIQCRLTGTAGQSFGAFLTKGMELRLKGIANDYVGKGMSSGMISIRMPKYIRRHHKDHTVIGNVALYGATGGEVFIAGKAGERFAVRNGGASGVIEGVGNHGCEYMTHGTIVILGEIGKNFGAGMTGGIVYVYAKRKRIDNYINSDFVIQSNINRSDRNLIIRFIRNHVFHTGSTIGKYLIDNWESEAEHFKKLTPTALEIIDIKTLYDLRINDRINVVLNE